MRKASAQCGRVGKSGYMCFCVNLMIAVEHRSCQIMLRTYETPHPLPSQASYELSVVTTLDKIDCVRRICIVLVAKPERSSRLDIQEIFSCPTSKISHFPLQITCDLEENFAQIHLPNWQFYLPWAVRPWDM